MKNRVSSSFIRTRMTWLAYILLALYAYYLNILGPITPFLHDEFRLSFTVSSLHFSAFAMGIIIIGLAGHRVIQRLGRMRSLAAGAIGMGASALLLVLGRSAAMTISASFLMGCVGSLILAVVPAALSQEHGEQRAAAISEANLLSSLFSSAAPLLVGWLAGHSLGWRLALVIAAPLAILLGALLIRPGRHEMKEMPAQATGTRLPFCFWYYWLILVLAVSVEFCMVFWSADFLVASIGLSSAGAARSVSLFLLGMIAGRLASGRAVRHFTARRVVLASLLSGMLGFLLYWSSTSISLGLAGLAITGLGVAGLYPLVLSMSIGASSGNESQAGTRASLASGTAILALPLLLGRLADITGIKTAFILVAVLFASMFILMAASKKLAPLLPEEQV